MAPLRRPMPATCWCCSFWQLVNGKAVESAVFRKGGFAYIYFFSGDFQLEAAATSRKRRRGVVDFGGCWSVRGDLLTIRWCWACDFSCVAHPYTLPNLKFQSLNQRMPGPKGEHVLMQKSTVAGRMVLLRDYLESGSPSSQCWWYTILGISS